MNKIVQNMVVANISTYQSICNNISAKRCSEQQLKVLKAKYADVIRSNRRLEQVQTLRDLVQILEKRDYLNPKTVHIFIEIARELDDNELIRYINSLNNTNNITTNDIQYHSYNNVRQSVLPQVPQDQKRRVYHYIAENIGQKWADFARALEIPEGYIDELDLKKSLSERLYEVLRYHEQVCDARFWRSSLLQALTDARRNDMRKKVQEIFDTT